MVHAAANFLVRLDRGFASGVDGGFRDYPVASSGGAESLTGVVALRACGVCAPSKAGTMNRAPTVGRVDFA